MPLIIEPIDNRPKCNQDECFETPTHIVYWPGKTPPPRMCEEHQAQAQRVLAAMGIPVHIEPIKET